MLGNLPFVRLSVDRAGALAAGTSISLPPGTTDLIVISHGWKNDDQHALTLYGTLLANVRAIAGNGFGTDGRRWAVAGVFWPAFRFRPDMSLLRDDGSAGLAANSGAGQGRAAAAADNDMPPEELTAYAATVANGFGEDDVAFAQAALEGARGGPFASAFVEQLRTLLTRDETLNQDHRALLKTPGGELHAKFAGNPAGAPLSFQSAAPAGDAGGAAGFKEVVQSFRQWRAGRVAGMATLLNQATYYEMKARAGVAGAALASVIERAASPPVRLHLIGHSFGARLVSSLASALTTIRPGSLTLLQGAFSHNGFGSATDARAGAAGVDGVFRRVITDKRIDGPIVVTHTRRDTAVGLLYPLASALTGTVAASFADVASSLIGGPDDKHGGLGANGALSLLSGEASAHVAVIDGGRVLLRARTGEGPGALSALERGRIHNVLADAIVAEHNDVANAGVATLVWAAIC